MSEKVDNAGVRFGMWLFLYTEIMLFGGLFILYAAYYYQYTQDFVNAGKKLDLVFGAANTLILLTSSFTIAAAIQSMKRDLKKATMILLGITIVLAFVFLVNKYIEWNHKFAADIFPGSEILSSGPRGVTIFFGLYFTLTGLHALHVLIGACVLSVTLVFVQRGKVSAERINIIENAGLYWHLVDIIWIFVFPLFYLIL